MKILRITALGVFLLCAALLLPSCASVKKIGSNAIATMLAGSNKKGHPVKKRADDPDVLAVVTGESDTVLVGEFFPTALKLYEIMQASNPDHQGLAVMTGSLNVMYANAFVQAPAERIPDDQFDRRYAEEKRAKMHYLRGRDYILAVFDTRYPGFKAAMLSSDEAAIQDFVAKLTERDVDAAYWCAAGALGAFALDPLDADLIGCLQGPVAMLERAAALAPDYSDGAIWQVLTAFYAAAPVDFGGDVERARACYDEAVRVSGGKSAGVYITYAESFCIPANDKAGFEEALAKALAINPDDDPSSRLMTLISQEKAQHLLEIEDEYFVEW